MDGVKEGVKEGLEKNDETKTEETKEDKTEQKIDVEKVKKDAINNLYSELGVDADSLKDILTKHKEDEENKKTDLQKKDDKISEVTKELVKERDARMIAEAKLSAIELGAKVELVEDLVIIAKSKVEDGKGIDEVIAEIKNSKTGSIYFNDSESEEEEEKNKHKNVTRSLVKNRNTTNKTDEKGDKSRFAGSMAERLLNGKKKQESYYYK